MSTEVKLFQGKETFDVIKRTVNKAVDFVRPTYGPASNKVIISKNLYKMVVDDGVQILRDLRLETPEENAVLDVIREVSIKTNDRVLDGTTGAALLMQGIINEVDRKTRFDGRTVELELKKGVEEAVAQLKGQAIPIESKEDLRKVARISFDDKEISEMIADTYFKLGKDGVITVSKSPTMETTIQTKDGITIENGYISPYMINTERMNIEVEKPLILITDYRLTEAKEVVKILETVAAQGKTEVVIIAENIEQNALATAIVNKVQGKFLTVGICAPKSPEKKQILEDMALMLGARFISEAKGDKIENITFDDFGTAERLICDKDETTIIAPKGDKGVVGTAITTLRAGIENEKDERTKQKMKKRLARFEGTIAEIKVGAMTDNEQKAIKYKVEDAVNAVKSAFNHGVVCGAGISLSQIKTSSSILNEALKYPARQLRENMGMEDVDWYDLSSVENAVTYEVGPFIDVGVIDPVEVLIAGVESAVSIASVLLTSCGMIVEYEKEGDK